MIHAYGVEKKGGELNPFEYEPRTWEVKKSRLRSNIVESATAT